MATTLDDNKLKQIIVTGKGLTAQLRDACSKATLGFAIDAVTQMSLTFEDTHDAQIFRSGVLARGATIRYGDWHLVSDGEKFGPGRAGPQLVIKAPSKFVTDLRKATGAYSWGNVDVAGWVRSIAQSVGMTHVVQPGLGNKTIVRKAGEDDSEPESTWDVLTQLSRETGVWLFEYGSTLVFARPSWLVSSAWEHREWPLHWDNWSNYNIGMQGMPEYSDDPGSEIEEQLVLRLISKDADSARPGDTIRLAGGGVGKMGGVWIVKSVDFPLSVAGVVTVTCQRPIDPKIEPPREDKPATSTKPASSSVSSGGSSSGSAPSGLAAATDRWASSVNGRSIDMDGAFGAQCVDVAISFNRNVVGGPGISGNGRDWYANGGRSGAYTQIGAGARAQKGDIACWGPAMGGGYGHVAIVLADQGGSVLTMSQNPGPTRQLSITKSGLQGYLRPKKWK
ncbi:minor tail protein [Arthrobacter phage Sonny]|uniref:Minor tail protein n=1 Tax=Arthrobacter phage Sonny TaxID=1772315 RepID=A0A0U4JPL1_9CAUD|nr:tail protein [Arthrobacter phage Sonny]ALY10289.1 minor tail protein [Arthrobacter phage Sonny]